MKEYIKPNCSLFESEDFCQGGGGGIPGGGDASGCAGSFSSSSVAAGTAFTVTTSGNVYLVFNGNKHYYFYANSACIYRFDSTYTGSWALCAEHPTQCEYDIDTNYNASILQESCDKGATWTTVLLTSVN